MVQPDDLLNTIRYLLNLSENVCIKDIVFEMKKEYYLNLRNKCHIHYKKEAPTKSMLHRFYRSFHSMSLLQFK